MSQLKSMLFLNKLKRFKRLISNSKGYKKKILAKLFYINTKSDLPLFCFSLQDSNNNKIYIACDVHIIIFEQYLIFWIYFMYTL